MDFLREKFKKREVFIIFFYGMYFIWLLVVTYLTSDVAVLTYFTVAISVFHLIFLREVGDLSWFVIAAFIPVVFAIVRFEKSQLKFDLLSLKDFPYWLSLAWGTTTVALRKLYFLLTK